MKRLSVDVTRTGPAAATVSTRTQTRVAVWLVLAGMAVSEHARAAISFTDGLWSSSLESCPEGTVSPGAFCGGWELEDAFYECTSTSTPAPLRSQISANANYPRGAGGRGFRLYQGDSRNVGSTAIAIRFTSPQPEVWVRYYTRYPVGQTWGGIVEHKNIYFYLENSNVAMNINFPEGKHSIGVQPRNTMGSPDIYVDGWGWNDLYGGDAGDGSWHLYEHHFRLGASGQNNGLYEFWIDGINRVSRGNLDFFNGGAATSTGLSHIYIPNNHNVSTLAGCNPIDIDDIAVAQPTYGNFRADANGRKMIGGIATSPGAPPAAPTGLRVQ